MANRFPIKLEIHDPHVSLNELLQWSRPSYRNPKYTRYSSWKNKHEGLIHSQMETQLRNKWTIKEHVQLYIVFHTTRRLDIDNLSAGTNKVIIDALKNTHILPDDSPKYLNKLTVATEKTNLDHDWTTLYIVPRSDIHNYIKEMMENKL